MIEVRKCPECGREDPVLGPRCLCGHAFPPPLPGQEATAQAKPKPRLWLALLPGLVTLALATGVVVPRWLQFSRVAGAITSGGAAGTSGERSTAGRLDCVEVYSVTLKSSEFYVREGIAGFRRPKYAPREVSTVVQGMASNRCGVPLTSVRIRINVRDDKGGRGSGWAQVGAIPIGQAKPFERAWMGRVTSYEVVEIR